LFGILFHFIRESDFYNSRILIADMGGLNWLYSSIASIFSILVAFAVNKLWDQWNELSREVKGECDAVEELWLWSSYLPVSVKEPLRDGLVSYFRSIISTGWRGCEKGDRNADTEEALVRIRRTIRSVQDKQPELIITSFNLFADLLRHRNMRLHYSARHMPRALRIVITLATFLVIIFSLFVGVRNYTLGLTFTVSLATLAFMVLQVIYDMDNPWSPGAWHLTTADYEQSLMRLTNMPLPPTPAKKKTRQLHPRFTRSL
jgi:hypothetical protein